jgi:Uncharacterised protein family (UPF0175)
MTCRVDVRDPSTSSSFNPSSAGANGLGAAKLFELGRLSSGKAAQLAGMDRVGFLYELNRIGVPAINLRDEEVEAEILAARDLAG